MSIVAALFVERGGAYWGRPRWSDDDRASPRFPYAWYLWDWAHQGAPILRFLPAGEPPAKELL